eukprot:scaffold153761_cov65-Attheya_sp.AAC.1
MITVDAVNCRSSTVRNECIRRIVMVSHWKSVDVNGSAMIRSSGPIKEVINDGVCIKEFDASHPIVFTKSEVF